MGLIQQLLAALSYTRAPSFDLADAGSVRALVVWLENMKIRHYKVEDRKVLADVGSPTWDAAFQQYLRDVECPVPHWPRQQLDVVLWLLEFAVNLEYSDAAATYNQAAPPPPKAEPSTSGRQPAFTDLGTAAVQQAVERLARLLQVDAGPGLLVKQLQAVKRVLGDEVLPSVGSGGTSSSGSSTSLQDLALGFSTGDEKVDAAATLLRLCYIQDLRALQSQVDGAIVAVQEMTANPRTDACLGKVGR